MHTQRTFYARNAFAAAAVALAGGVSALPLQARHLDRAAVRTEVREMADAGDSGGVQLLRRAAAPVSDAAD